MTATTTYPSHRRLAWITSVGAILVIAVPIACVLHRRRPAAILVPDKKVADTREIVRHHLPHPPRKLFMPIEALSYEERCMGKDAKDHVGFLSADTYLKYEQVDFADGANWFVAYCAVSDASAGNTIEVRRNSPTGPILAALVVQSTGGWGEYATQIAPMTAIDGVQDIYLTFSGGSSVADLRWFKFTHTPRNARETIPARSYDVAHRIVEHDDSIGYLDEGKWVRFGGLYFGTGVTRFTADLAVPDNFAGKYIDLRLDLPTNPIIASLKTQSTSGWDTPSAQQITVPTIDGSHDLYLTFRGGTGVADLYSIRFGD